MPAKEQHRALTRSEGHPARARALPRRAAGARDPAGEPGRQASAAARSRTRSTASVGSPPPPPASGSFSFSSSSSSSSFSWFSCLDPPPPPPFLFLPSASRWAAATAPSNSPIRAPSTSACRPAAPPPPSSSSPSICIPPRAPARPWASRRSARRDASASASPGATALFLWWCSNWARRRSDAPDDGEGRGEEGGEGSGASSSSSSLPSATSATSAAAAAAASAALVFLGMVVSYGGGARRLEEGERRRLKKKKAAAGVQWVPGTRFSFHYARQGHGKGVGGVGAKKPPTAKTTAETPDVLNPTPYGNSKLPFAPPAEGERGFGFLSSSRSEMGERTSSPVSPNQEERPWEEEGWEDTWMPRSNHLVVHLPTIYIIIYMLCCWGLPASAPLSVSSRLVSHKHTQTHTTPQIHHPSYSFFFFTA